MKRINWFKTIGLTATSIAAATPVVMLATSCTPTSMVVDNYTYETLKTAVQGGAAFETASSSTVSFERLLIGDTSINDGNFILFVGTNANPTTCQFFSGDKNVRRKEDWFSASYFINSVLFKGVTEDKKPEVTKIPFTMFNMVDYCPKSYYDTKGKRLYLSTDGKSPNLDYVHPFRKWDSSLTDTTYRYNAHERKIDGGTYEWDKESVTDKDYIRNDAAAVAYRTFNELGAKLYPVDEKAKEPRKVTFSTKNEDASRIVIFKSGVLKHIDAIPASGDALAELINKYFIEEEKK